MSLVNRFMYCYTMQGVDLCPIFTIPGFYLLFFVAYLLFCRFFLFHARLIVSE